jgi:hypothetical protein
MARRRKPQYKRPVSRAIDAIIGFLVKWMITSMIIGAGLVVASEFYEPALGKWAVVIAVPYALIIPMYFMKLTLFFYEKVTGSFLKH